MGGNHTHSHPRRFLFLQGPISPFFAELGARLQQAGHRVLRVNLNAGDLLFWHAFASGAGQVINYRGRLASWPAWVEARMRGEQITDLILLGEQRPYQKAAIQAARQLGIAVTVTDFGYLRPDWIVLEPDGMNGDSRLPRAPAAIRALAAQAPEPDLARRFADDFSLQARWDVLYHLLALAGRPFFPFYRSYHIHHPLLTYLGTGWRLLRRPARTRQAEAVISRLHQANTRYWLLPMQMEVDFSIRAYSPFPDMLTPLRVIIQSFAVHAARDEMLVVKLHPLDPGLRDWSRLVRAIAAAHHAAGRVIFIDGGELDTLLQRTRGLVTVNSTAGIWAIRAGVPVKILGQAVYGIEGLVHPGDLASFWRDPARPDSALANDFLRAIAGFLHIRGVYYHPLGRAHAIAAAADWLASGGHAALSARLRAAALAEHEPARLLTEA